jgi:hypothetical protein
MSFSRRRVRWNRITYTQSAMAAATPTSAIVNRAGVR